ncbi:MAG TPA: type II toxin-antitoxin system RelE/ParE family toxin [Syntrophomonadaceae bacterium]|nr:type II toxin-antitoxin system RelE/ParE family toxin [Syntrophomonadaceae bacterium]
MANNYTIKMTPKAVTDLDNLYSYISEELFAPNPAMHILERIEKGIMNLKVFPFSCNYVADEFLRSKGYRKLIIDNYIAFYLVDKEKKQVIIMRVLYGKQKYENLL